MKKYTHLLSVIIIGVLTVVGTVSAATTISTDITTGGVLTASGIGDSSFVGNLGIGSTTPYAKLSVSGSGVLGGTVTASSFVGTSTATTTFGGNIKFTGTSAVTQIHTYYGGLYLGKAAGDPSYGIEQSGTISIGGVNTSRAGTHVFGYDSVSVAFTDSTIDPNNPIYNDLFNFSSGGNFGIGIASPGAPLDVNTLGLNATTSIKFGKAGQNKGTCLQMYDAVGAVKYVSIQNGAFVITSTSCK